MTPKQRQLYDWICAFVATHGYSPTYRQMAAAVGLKSVAGIHRIVTALAERGYVTRVPGRHCSVWPTERAIQPEDLGLSA